MTDLHNAFVTKVFLRSVWALDFEAFKDGEEERQLLDRLNRWASRTDLKETAAEAAFLEEFFRRTWGYVQSGQDGSDESFTLYPKFSIPGAGAKGGPGEADAALGYFNSAGGNLIPQVLCEFKDIKSALDAPQKRKGNNRSPVRQGLDYLAAARRGLFGDEPILPTWAIVTDMNEFRLYWADRGHQQFLRFTIRPSDLFQGPQLLGDSDEARFDRFLFYRVFHRDTLLVKGASGRPLLAQLIAQQWVRERELETAFYREYRAYREHLYRALLTHNGEGSDRFPGTRGRLVRLAQKILDRCLFVFFCEDMGRALGYPPQLLRDFLIHETKDAYFDPNGGTIWERLKGLFHAMNDGTAFGKDIINQFNGGLFAPDAELEKLYIPNRIFCVQGQGQNEASLYSHQLTLLYLSASYNYAAGWAESAMRPPVDEHGDGIIDAKKDPSKSLGLHTLGRIFEQSITELEILEAEADGRPSVNKESKRKRDGVYYTPEWIVEHIVDETLGGRLSEIKTDCGWPPVGSDKLPKKEAILSYEAAIKEIKIVDPACGSGAFLITSLRYLLDEWRALQELRKQVEKSYTIRKDDEDRLIREILRENIYGVDINPASVEITKLALWLHTARGDKPLSSLDEHIRDGNSLIGSDFYKGLLPYTPEEQERINAFDWKQSFSSVFESGGFDVVVGNPPYVKLQNFRKAHEDMAEFLKVDRTGSVTYESTQTGNFDLFLPFIEKGIALLNDMGRLGYIAPSLWTMNDYGVGLRNLIKNGGNLYGWIDFCSHQIFDEATTYTALQFYSKHRNESVKVIRSPDGAIPDNLWAGNDASLSYEKLRFGDRWLMITGRDRELIDRLYSMSRRLDDPRVTENIFVGIQTSADHIYHLKRIQSGRYLCVPRSADKESAPYEVAIEDAIMKPLVSGPDAKRYVNPSTQIYILFPYELVDGRVRLIPPADMERHYPWAWHHLKSYEGELRRREAALDYDGEFKVDKHGKKIKAPFDDDAWYRFGRHQNLDKQEFEKLIVAQTVPSLRVCYDPSATLYLNNVRVNGITTKSKDDGYFVLGILNSPVSNFVFKRIAKPKDGGWFEANKQFIAPLPIANASEEEKTEIARLAEILQELHTRRRDHIASIGRRLQAVRLRTKSDNWLFPELTPRRELELEAPARLEPEDKIRWADDRHTQNLEARYAAITALLKPDAVLDAELVDGELRFLIDGRALIQRVFVAADEGAFILAQWKLLASTFSITEKTDGKKLATALRKIGATDNTALTQQVIASQQSLSNTEAEIQQAERALNQLIYKLYQLTDDEVRLVERG